jgi:hypothetical protein
MVNVSNGSYVHMRFCPLELLLRHVCAGSFCNPVFDQIGMGTDMQQPPPDVSDRQKDNLPIFTIEKEV